MPTIEELALEKWRASQAPSPGVASYPSPAMSSATAPPPAPVVPTVEDQALARWDAAQKIPGNYLIDYQPKPYEIPTGPVDAMTGDMSDRITGSSFGYANAPTAREGAVAEMVKPPDTRVETGAIRQTNAPLAGGDVPLDEPRRVEPSSLASGAALPAPRARSGGVGGAVDSLSGLKKAASSAATAVDASNEAERQAVTAQGERRAETGEVRASEDARQAEKMQSDAEQEARNTELDATAAKTYAAETERRADAIRTKKVDPERVWKSKDAGAKALSIFAVALGGFASGFGGGPNTALQMIDKEIDRDIAAQESAIRDGKAEIDDRRGALNQMMKLSGDMATGRASARALYYTALGKMAESNVGLAKTNEERANAQAIVAGLKLKEDEAKKVEAKHAFEQARAARVAGEAQARAADAARQKAITDTAAKLVEKGEPPEEAMRTAVYLTTGAKIGDAPLRAPTGTESKKDLDKQVMEYSDRVSKLTEAEVAARGIEEMLPKDKNAPIPGLGYKSDALAAVVPDAAHGQVFTADELRNRQLTNQAFNAYKTAVTGSSGAEKEMEDLRRSAFGAKTAGEYRRFLTRAVELVKERRAAIDAGFTPEVRDAYRRNAPGTERQQLEDKNKKYGAQPVQ